MMGVLNWKTDPLLQDVTLNELVANTMEPSERQVLINNPLANFYGILVKKQEFSQNTTLLTKTRILPRMPYLPLNHYPFLKEQLQERSWLLAEKNRDYFYGSAMMDNAIKDWKQRIERYVENNAIPLPMLRGDEELWQQLTKHVLQEQQIIIQAAKGERSIIPLKLTEKLVYLLGIIDGDGNLAKHQIHIVDYSKKQIEQIQGFFKELCGVPGDIKEGNEGNYYILLVNAKWLVRLVTFLTGHPTGRKYKSLQEPLILREPSWERLRGAYWRGLFDADGSYRNTLTFATNSKQLSDDLEGYFSSLGVNYKVTYDAMKSYTMYVYAGTRKKVFDAIGSWHPEKRREFQQLLGKNWYGSLSIFQGLENNNLIDSTFFDFAKLPDNIRLINGGRLFIQLRKQKQWTQVNLASKLAISLSSLCKYEQLTINPGLKLMKKLFAICEIQDIKKRIHYLESNSLQYYTYKTRQVKYPFRVSDEVLQVMNCLHPRSDDLVVLLSDTKASRQLAFEIFGISFVKFRPTIRNLALNTFLQTFGHYSSYR